MDARSRRQARNEAFVRDINERLEEIDRSAETSGWPPPDGLYDFHCECGRGSGCTERISMTLSEYEAIRTQDDRFAVVPGHEDAALERVVDRNERFLVVDKVSEAEPLVADDPRGASSE